MKTISKLAVSAGVFLVMFAVTTVHTYAYTLDFGGSDYGYSYTPASYDYGGSDYGYSYSNASYDYGGSDYGYSYTPASYDYGGSDYGYTYSYPSYDYGGSDYGYSYTPASYDYGGSDYGYSYTPASYDYGGSDYGYSYTPASYDYGGSDYGYTYSYPSYDYGGSDYGYNYTPASYDYGGSSYSYNYETTPSYVYEETPQYAYDYSYPSYSYDYSYPSYSYGGGYVYPSYGFGYSYPTYSYNNVERRPVCTLVADDTRIKKGESTRLTWSARHTDDVDINQGIGSVEDRGSETVSPNRTTTYTLIARGDGGTRTCTETVYVEDTVKRLSCDSFTVSDTDIEKGDRVTLEWRTTGASSVRIDNGVGSVEDDGSKRVTVDEDTTFTLTARNGSDEDTCSVHVDVKAKPDRKVQCDAFTVSDSRVKKGDRVTLEWRTTNADSVRINQGVGSVEDDGSKRVTVDEDTTFTLTARNGSDEDTCTVRVKIEDKKDTSKLRCELTASDTRINAGDRVRLSWDNTNADRIVLKDDNGKELADSKDDRKIDEDKDSITVHPRKTTEYTLTAYDGSKKRTCDVTVKVGNDVSVTTTRSQDMVSLAQLPYTGFDAGPTLTALFYGAIVLWGIVLAYILVMRKKQAVLATEGASANVTPVAVSATPVVATAVTPIADTVPFNLPVAETVVPTETMLRDLEATAHAEYALVSSDALRYIASQEGDAHALLLQVIARAKAQFPKEGDWIVINKERVTTLLS